MPQEIFDVNKFIEVANRAKYCAMKKLKKTVKLKLRTSKGLYTIKVDPEKAEEIMKKISCEVREV